MNEKTENLRRKLSELDLTPTYDEHLSSSDIDKVLLACKEARLVFEDKEIDGTPYAPCIEEIEL